MRRADVVAVLAVELIGGLEEWRRGALVRGSHDVARELVEAADVILCEAERQCGEQEAMVDLLLAMEPQR